MDLPIDHLQTDLCRSIKQNSPRHSALLFGAFLFFACLPCTTLHAATFPADKLPSHITKLVDIGERCEWSHDTTILMYVTGSGGEVNEINLTTRATRTITGGQTGYYRAYYLSNGDYLLTKGPDRGAARLYLLDKSLSRPATDLGVIVLEGAAVSRTRLKIAYMSDWNNIYTADIVYTNGIPALANKVEVVSNGGGVEPQSFRPPLEDELIYACYGCGSHEIYGVNLTTLQRVNYSNSATTKEEPEGMFPDGVYTLFESDKHRICGDPCVDIYRMRLNGTGTDYIRLTEFNEVQASGGNRYKASNPSVRDDGKCFCFQEALSSAAPGVGQGIYIYDIAASGLYDTTGPAIDSNAILGAQFSSGADGFVYSDDAFRNTAQPAYANGTMCTSCGKPGGALVVTLGGIDANSIQGMSGGWSRQFSLSQDTSITVSLWCLLDAYSGMDAGEWSQCLVAVDGVLYGAGSQEYLLAYEQGGGNSGWRNFTIPIGRMAAGTHTLTIGGHLAGKTANMEIATVSFDNVQVLATRDTGATGVRRLSATQQAQILQTRQGVHATFFSRTNLTFDIYDARGRRVLSLADGMREAGSYTLDISQEASLNAGVYLYKCTVGDRTISGRITKTTLGN